MNLKRLERRDSSMDLIRIVAVFLVMSVHFLYHTSKTVENTAKMGFYNLTVDGFGPIEGIVKYFQTGDPIRKTLIVFVLATFICMTFKSINLVPAAKTAFEHFDLQGMFEAIDATHKYDLKHYLLSIFDFSGANYSWYVEMYIGLFLIAPFLNLAYNKLESQRKKQVLVATLVVLTILPSLINAFRFDSAEWWLKPISETKGYQKLIPSFWMGAMYPVAYYFTGAYIREYGIKLKTRSHGVQLLPQLRRHLPVRLLDLLVRCGAVYHRHAPVCAAQPRARQQLASGCADGHVEDLGRHLRHVFAVVHL